jgi:hypothetical protein
MSDKKKELPPTVKMLNELIEHINHPAMTPFLDRLLKDIPTAIRTRAGTGAMLTWMSTKIEEYESKPTIIEWALTDGFILGDDHHHGTWYRRVDPTPNARRP